MVAQLNQHDMVLKELPNFFTMLRIGLIPILVMSFYVSGKAADYLSLGIFVFASITDCIDGFLARSLKAQTSFGRMFDPIADKMLIASTLLMMVEKRIAPVLPIIAILCREFFVSGMREYLAERKSLIEVNGLAKIKTLIQMVAIVMLLLGRDDAIPYMKCTGQLAIWIAAALTIASGYSYFKRSLKYMR